MFSKDRIGGRLPLWALAPALGFWLLAASPGSAGDGEAAPSKKDKPAKNKHVAQKSACGTLGYGAPGLYPGFQGFGLGYHLGYGYGGRALGVGAKGGYPSYGGPGYFHPSPQLRRIGGETPLCYFGGPGYPTPGCPNYFGGVGPLSPDQPVITFDPDPTLPASDGGYGPFDGTLAYPETTFAPFATVHGGAGTSGGTNSAYLSVPSPETSRNPGAFPPPVPVMPGPGTSSGPSPRGRFLGTEEESTVDVGGTRGLKISKVYVDSAAERAGLRPGDVILSINGYRTTKPDDLAWIIADASSSKSLKVSVRSASDGKARSVTAQLPD